jgi:hypothetical protein
MPGVLYVIGCAAPPVLGVKAVIELAQERGWSVCLILTPTAARWLEADLPALAGLTAHPIRSAYKLPGQPDVLPEPDAILVAPATANTITKWAAGIADNLALGLITEAIGKGLPLVAIPYFNAAQAAHPALPHSVDVLAGAGVAFLTSGNQDGARPEDFPWQLGLEALGR